MLRTGHVAASLALFAPSCSTEPAEDSTEFRDAELEDDDNEGVVIFESLQADPSPEIWYVQP